MRFIPRYKDKHTLFWGAHTKVLITKADYSSFLTSKYSNMQQQDPQRRRKAIPNEWKAALRAQKRLHPYLTHHDLRKWFEDTYKQAIDRPSVSRILSPKYAFIDELKEHQLKDKRRRTEQWPESENAIMDWIKFAEAEAPISQEAIRYKTQQYRGHLYTNDPTPSFSNGWLYGFQTRNNIKNRKRHGEAASLATDAASEMIKIRRLLASYPPQDIFNCDESGLYWKLFPDRSLSTRSLPGHKKDKVRISILFACNSDGSERLPLWIIGKAKKPRAFSQAHIEPHNLGIQWRSNTKAWMTGNIFKEWLYAFDTQMTGRNVILLMDNFSAHESAVDEVNADLKHTTIIWLPPNSTTKYQPLDQGIIQAWKALWKREWVRYIIDEFDRGVDPLSTMTILRGVRWAVNMWENQLTSTAITNCFKKALHIEAEEEFETALLVQDLQKSLQDLKLTNRVQDIMDINQFLNPADEQVNDTMVNIDNIVLSQFDLPQIEEPDEDIVDEPIPLITSQEAIQSLRILRLYEEQRDQADNSFIRVLSRYENQVTKEKVATQRQTDIRRFFQ